MSKPLASASTSQIVTLPHLPELFDPNFLDVLLPPKPVLAVTPNLIQLELNNAANLPEEVLEKDAKAAKSRTRTDNGDSAFSSTGSATLDAF
jgi:hypothetical protein